MTTVGNFTPDLSVATAFKRSMDMPPRLGSSKEGTSAASDDQKSRGQAWLREMERAQVTGWFLPFEAGSAKQESLPPRSRAQAAPRPFVQSKPTFAPAKMERSAHVEQPGQSAGPETPKLTRQIGQDGSGLSIPADRALNPEEGSASEATASAGTEHSVEFAQVSQGPTQATQTVPHPGSGWQGVAQSGAYQATPLPITVTGQPEAQLAAAQEHGVESARPAFALGSASLPSMPPGLQTVRTTQAGTPPALTQAFGGVSANSALDQLQPEAQAKRPGASAPLQSERSPATRLHSQWTVEGLRLWIGADGTAQQVQLQASTIVGALHRSLKDQGLKLSRVVCNGSVVFDAQASADGAGPFTDFTDVVARSMAPAAFNDFIQTQSPKETL